MLRDRSTRLAGSAEFSSSLHPFLLRSEPGRIEALCQSQDGVFTAVASAEQRVKEAAEARQNAAEAATSRPRDWRDIVAECFFVETAYHRNEIALKSAVREHECATSEYFAAVDRYSGILADLSAARFVISATTPIAAKRIVPLDTGYAAPARTLAAIAECGGICVTLEKLSLPEVRRLADALRKGVDEKRIEFVEESLSQCGQRYELVPQRRILKAIDRAEASIICERETAESIVRCTKSLLDLPLPPPEDWVDRARLAARELLESLLRRHGTGDIDPVALCAGDLTRFKEQFEEIRGVKCGREDEADGVSIGRAIDRAVALLQPKTSKTRDEVELAVLTKAARFQCARDDDAPLDERIVRNFTSVRAAEEFLESSRANANHWLGWKAPGGSSIPALSSEPVTPANVRRVLAEIWLNREAAFRDSFADRGESPSDKDRDRFEHQEKILRGSEARAALLILSASSCGPYKDVLSRYTKSGQEVRREGLEDMLRRYGSPLGLKESLPAPGVDAQTLLNAALGVLGVQAPSLECLAGPTARKLWRNIKIAFAEQMPLCLEAQGKTTSVRVANLLSDLGRALGLAEAA